MGCISGKGKYLQIEDRDRDGAGPPGEGDDSGSDSQYDCMTEAVYSFTMNRQRQR